jgi:membrane associated rhomboid family serine protease
MVGLYPNALSDWGGKNAINILEDGEWWRLVTPIMLHAGIIHLLCNVAIQLETGTFFECKWGAKQLLAILE